MKKIFFLILILSVCCGSSFAQKRKKKPAAPKVVVPEKTPQELLFEELLPSTAKVMFIDSVVVDKANFLEHIPFASEMGSITVEGEKVSYINEFGNTSIYASGDSITGRHLYMTHRYGKNWDQPSKLSELNNEMVDFPFLMADGVTLYFASSGEGTVGGYDVFRTTYNAEDAEFYEAINMGMPFNSPSNEYLMAISDMDNLGWLVSDRYQEEGKVCIYTFEPTAQRQTFDEDTEEETLKSFALTTHIKDTWKFGDRAAAMKRVANMKGRMSSKKSDARVFFVVNDNKTITSLADFKSPDGAKKYQEIENNKAKLSQLNSLLESTRENYITVNKAKKHEIGRKVVELEEEVYTLETSIKEAEKALRNIENK